MKFVHTFFNKKAYREDKSQGIGILNLFWASGISMCIYFIIAISVYISAFGTISPQDLYVKYSDLAISEIPSDLKLIFKNGYISQNTKGVVNIGKINKTDSSNYYNYEYWVQIDDSKVASLESYNDSKAIVFIGNDGMVAQKSRTGQIQIMPASRFGDMEVDKTKVNSISHSFADMVWKIVILGAIFIFIFGVVGIFVGNLIWNLLLAALVMATGMIKKSQPYSDSLRYVNHAAVPAIIITSIFNFTFFYTILVIGTLYLTFRFKNKE